MKVVVTGMHRSGTSAVAGLVDRLLPSGTGPVMSGRLENPRGFFEREDVAGFNEAWLARLGAAWWAPRLVSPSEFTDVPEQELIDARRQLDLTSAEDSWYVKDPRLSLLLPLWDRLTLEHLPVVVCLRDPFAVADSLALRNGFTLRRSLAIWSRYTSALLAAADRPSLVLDYDKALADPESANAALVAFLGRPASDTTLLQGVLAPELNRSVSRRSARQPELQGLADVYEQLSAHHGRALPTGAQTDEPDWVSDLCSELAQQLRFERQAAARPAEVPPVAVDGPALDLLHASDRRLDAIEQGLAQSNEQLHDQGKRWHEDLSELRVRAEETGIAQADQIARVEETVTSMVGAALEARTSAGSEETVTSLTAALRTEAAYREDLFQQVLAARARAREAELEAQAEGDRVRALRAELGEQARQHEADARRHEAEAQELVGLRDELALVRDEYAGRLASLEREHAEVLDAIAAERDLWAVETHAAAAELADRDARLEELRAQLSRVQHASAKWRRRAEGLGRAVDANARLRADLVRLRSLQDERQRELESRTARLASSERLVEELRHELADLIADDADEPAPVPDLQPRVQELESLVRHQLEALTRLVLEAEAAETQLAAAQQAVRSGADDVHRLTTELAATHDTRRALEGRAGEAEGQLAALRAAREAGEAELLVLRRMCDLADGLLVEALQSELDLAGSRIMRLAARLRRTPKEQS